MTLNDVKKTIKGVTAVLVTPFKEDLNVDFAGLRSNVQFLINKGLVYGSGLLVPNGSTGECFSLTIEQRKEVAEVVMDEARGKVGVYIGVNHTNIDLVIELSKHAEDIKADGIMLIPPYYWCPPSKEQILAFYKAVADKVNLPIMIYNNASVTAIDMSVDILSALAEIDNVLSLKECTPSIFKFDTVCRAFKDKLAIISGAGAVEPYGGLMGNIGHVAGLANVLPEQELKVHRLISDGNFIEAKKFHDTIAPFYNFGQRLNQVRGGGQIIAAFKAGLDMIGQVGGFMKLPILPLSAKEKDELRQILINAGAKLKN